MSVKGNYQLSTVILSFMIAWFAAFLAIQLAGRVRGEVGSRRTSLWIWAGGTALGLGIWSMHFTGMLAFHLPIPVMYDVRLTAISALPAILSSAWALYIAGTNRRSLWQLLQAAVLMGLGICAMHYLGMAAITFVPSAADYAVGWVVASVGVAIAVSLVALTLLTRFSWDREEARFDVQIGAAALMGLGVCSMHYTGMAALHLSPGAYCISRPGAVPGDELSLVIVGIAVLFMIFMMVGSHRELRQAERRFRELFECSPGAMVMIDSDGLIALANAEAERLLGYSDGELVGQSLENLMPPRLRPDHLDWLRRDARTLTAYRIDAARDLCLRHHDGGEIPVELRLSPQLIDRRHAVLASIVDLTERKRAEESIRRLAYFDSLTGLPNRSHFKLSLGESLQNSRAEGIYLMFADLDGFKEINDSLGHSTGDSVLIQIAQRLRETVGTAGEVFRFGGDEFIILAPARDDTDDGYLASELIRQISAPLLVDGQQIGVTLSIGSVHYPTHGEEHDQLLRRADNALYHAKAAGKNLHLRFNADMEESVRRHFAMLNELRHAVELGQLVLLYQPVIELRSRRVVGAEALVYWDHPQLGRITPATFIPVAEESGLIESMGEWVLFEAVRQAAQWRAQGLPLLRMAVNVSCVQFRDPDRLRDAVRDALREHAYPADGLELEITERQIMYDPGMSIATMNALSDLGVILALDDFGTGYSSFSYLRQFPLDKLKIDRSFTNQIDADPAGHAIVRAVAELGHHLGMVVVAEGIEREAQVGPLLACSCAEAQGFLFGRPMSALAFETQLRESLVT
jgi:diguanylate cyclase (GGDEF)-like protein/PAS domain S-box-containing protein